MKKHLTMFAVAHDLLEIDGDPTRRGIKRLDYFCRSLANSTRPPDQFYIVCTGEQSEYFAIRELLAKYDFVHTYHHQQPDGFNKSAAMAAIVNPWIFASSWNPDNYVLLTDVDYLFSPDLLEAAMGFARKGRLLVKRVKRLPKGAVTDWRIDKWDFVARTPFGYWPYSCGAFLLHHVSDYLTLGGFDKRFNVGAMDWHYRFRFEREIGQVTEVKRGEILHQWHPISKDKWKKDARRNEAIARKELNL